MAPTIVLITGASRGIGRGLLEQYISKPHHTIIAANRDPSHATSQELTALPTAEGTVVKLVKLDATSETDGAVAAETLRASWGIEHIDILIANAGIAFVWPKIDDVRIEDIKAHFETNVFGFVRLYQAFAGFLRAARDPKLVTIGSSAANAITFPNAAYGPTKIVQHWYTKTISVQEPWLTAFPIDPGFVQTEMGNRGANNFGLEKAIISVDESVRGVVRVIDESTRETHSGKLWKWTGEEEPW
ncbi:NAD(P)-binding protein [Aspergillus lucknowensis]|uniref:NAD(P)-binding protein n=1 Tax=Aspergillus lucknowensis TaxID=176173 RepID=A0ABR4LHC8_9EURO